MALYYDQNYFYCRVESPLPDRPRNPFMPGGVTFIVKQPKLIEIRSKYNAILRELSFITGRGGRLFVGGTRIFWGSQRGGTKIFSVGQRGDQNFFRVKEGGTKIFSQKFFCAFGAVSS